MIPCPTGGLPPGGRPSRRTVLLAAGLVLTGCASTPATSSTVRSTRAGTTKAAAGRSTVTLLRHAESIASSAGIISTVVPGQGLTDDGRGQARRAASALAMRGYDGLFCSPLARAFETAEAFAPLTDQQVMIVDGLAEITAGDFEGGRASDADQFLAVLSGWLRGRLDTRVPGGESGTEFLGRMDAAMAQVTASATNALVVGHGEAIRCWTALRVPSAGTEELRFGPTGYLVLSLEGGAWQVLESEAEGF